MQMGAYYVRVIKSSKISYKLHEKQFRISISLLKFGVKLFFSAFIIITFNTKTT